MPWFEATCPNGHTWESHGIVEQGITTLDTDECPDCESSPQEVFRASAPDDF